MQLSAIILTKNEAHHITACLESLSWCDQVVVFDSLSTDGTQELAAQAGAQVLEHTFRNFADQRNAALEAATTPWVLFVDADERATPELAAEARTVIAEREDIVAWWIPRHNIIFGKLTRGAGYYPDHQLRLVRVGAGHYEREASEIFVHEGHDAVLTGHLIHYNYESVAQFHAKQRSRARFEAATLNAQGTHIRPYSLVVQPLRHFWWRFVTLEGYRDGLHGLRISALLAYYFGWYNYRTLQRMRRAGELPLSADGSA